MWMHTHLYIGFLHNASRRKSVVKKYRSHESVFHSKQIELIKGICAMGENGISAAEAVLLNGQNQRGYGDDWGMMMMYPMWMMMMWFLVGGNGGFGNWGNNRNQEWQSSALTRAELSEGFNFNNLERKVDGVTNGLCDGFYATAQNINNVNTNLMQQSHAQEIATMQGFNAIGAQLSQNNFNQEQCCCSIKNLIQQSIYENAKNTCDIMQNNDKNTQRVVDMYTQG